ncbi:MAG: hypothetical protein WBH85_06875 [Thermoanaerobaculia bacterium]
MLNQSSERLTFTRDRLPWNSTGQLALVAVHEHDLQTLVKQLFPIEDSFDFSRVTLAPGETLSGTLHLGKYFPDLKNVLKDNSILLFWSYTVITLDDERPFERAIGGVRIGRQEGAEKVPASS